MKKITRKETIGQKRFMLIGNEVNKLFIRNRGKTWYVFLYKLRIICESVSLEESKRDYWLPNRRDRLMFKDQLLQLYAKWIYFVCYGERKAIIELYPIRQKADMTMSNTNGGNVLKSWL